MPSLILNQSTLLSISSRGTGVFRFPTPSDGLEIPVYDGTDTALEPLYVSIRAKRSSGNVVLPHSQLGDSFGTYYKFGPWREPDAVGFSSAEVWQSPLLMNISSLMLATLFSRYRCDHVPPDNQDKIDSNQTSTYYNLHTDRPIQ